MQPSTAEPTTAKKGSGILTTGLTLAFAGILIFNKGQHVTPDEVKRCVDENDKAQKTFRQESGFFLTEAQRHKYLDIMEKYRTCVKAASNGSKKQTAISNAQQTDKDGVYYDFK